MIESGVAGALPRPGRLISKTRAYDRGRITMEELEEAFAEATRQVVQVQVDAGLTYVNDGYLRRQDLLRPYTEGLGGVEAGQLYRWFNNNTFYRMPVIRGPLEAGKPLSTDVKPLPGDLPWKAVLPAPYTFTKLSRDEHYGDEGRLMRAVAALLNRDIKALERRGFRYIQLSDPALVYRFTAPERSDLPGIGEAVNTAVSGVEVRTCLQTFFGDASTILPEALEWETTDLGIDMYETDPQAIKQYSVKGGLSLGVVDARNTLQEDAYELASVVAGLTEACGPEHVTVSTNCDLDFLTWPAAQEKMKTLTRVQRILGEGLS